MSSTAGDEGPIRGSQPAPAQVAVAWNWEPMRFPELRAARNAEEFLLHSVALEWALDGTIAINEAQDIASTVHWRERGLEPFAHQIQNLITFCRRAPVALIADDVGLGKTISAGLIMSELIVRKRVNRSLVICPKLLLPQWHEELLTKFGIDGLPAVGAELSEALRRARDVVVITTYESARSRFDAIRQAGFQLLVLDEAHRLRNLHGGQAEDGPLFARAIRAALAERMFKFVVMLTATPVQNRVWDLYSLIDCLTTAKGHANPLGDRDQFRSQFIAGDPIRATRVVPERRDEFRRILSQYMVRTRRGDSKLPFPTRVVQKYSGKATEGEASLMAVVGRHMQGLSPLLQTSVGQALMSSPEALRAQIENMEANGTVTVELAAKVRDVVARIPVPGKLGLLDRLIAELSQQRPQDWRLVVFTIRRETQKRIVRHLVEKGVRTGVIEGGKSKENERWISAFKQDPPTINVLVSTDTGAEGINLQVANVLVNYDLPWNPMIMEQRIGRLQRLASKHQEVRVLNFVLAGSVEEKVVARLVEKLQLVSETVGDIDPILESAGGDLASDEGFESLIRNLVVASLKGQDVEELMRRSQESIERGKQIYDEQHQAVEQQLGQLDAMHHSGPRMPRLTETKPSMTEQDFTLRALRADGAVIQEHPGPRFHTQIPGRAVEWVTFDPKVEPPGEEFFTPVHRLYRRGEQHFERLVGLWSARAQHHVHDVGLGADGSVEALARAYLAEIVGAALEEAEVLDTRPVFQGEACCRATAYVAHDRYQKLIQVPLGEEGATRAVLQPSEEQSLADSIDPQELVPDLRERVHQATAHDKDIAAFSTFYNQQLDQELARAPAGQSKRIQADYRPTVAAEVVGLRGVRHLRARLSVFFTLDGQGGYAEVIDGLPATGQILSTPPLLTCDQTARLVPAGCLQQCCVTGKKILRHLLVRSEKSGLYALAEYTGQCAVTQKRMLKSELAPSAVSGTVVDAGILVQSGVSGRRALQSEVGVCEFTGTKALLDELLTSDVSGKLFIAQEKATSTTSNKVGHKSELVRCEVTGDLLLPQEAGKSDVSGKTVRKELLVASTRPPGRVGLTGEAARCAVTGHQLLRDEVAASAVSGKVCDRTLLVPSESSGELALPSEMVTCAETGRRLLPGEVGSCSVTGGVVDSKLLARSEVSGAQALARLMVQCEITGARVLSSELVVSSHSGRRFRVDQKHAAQTGNRVAHVSECVRCAETGALLLPDEVGTSAVSGKRVRKELLIGSEKDPSRQGLKDELARCEATGRLLLRDELGQSAVSGRTCDREILRASDRSGLLAMPDELVTCQASGSKLLPSETVKCQATQQLVDKRLTELSSVSGKPALKDKLASCGVSGDRVLPSELIQSDYSGKQVRRDQVEKSELSGRTGHIREFVSCPVSGSRVLLDELGKSDLSGKQARIDLLIASEGPSRRRGLLDELGVCEVTGKRLLLDEMDRSAVSALLVDRSLLVPSDRDGFLALPHELMACQETGRKLLPSQLARCEATGLLVDDSMLEASEASGRRALRRGIERCEVTGRTVLADELETCGISGRRALGSEFATCAVSQRRALNEYFEISDVSGLPVLKELATKSIVSGKPCLPGEAVECSWNEGPILPAEAAICSLTGLNFHKKLVKDGKFKTLYELLSGWTGAYMRPDLLPWARSLPRMSATTDVVAISSPSQKRCAVMIELTTMLGFKVRYVGMVLDEPSKTILGTYVIGTNTPTGFVVQESHSG